MKIIHRLALIALFSFFACKPQQSDSAREQLNEQTKSVTVDASVELAPFDKYPVNGKFPLVFRFSAAVATPDRTASQNFEKLQIMPAKYGSWQWASDSELRFEPQEDWVPGEKLKVSLAGLKTSAGKFGQSANFSPAEFAVQLPKPEINITSCSLQVKNKAPLVQYPSFSLKFNYPAQLANAISLADLKIKSDGLDSTLQLKSLDSTESNNSITFEGPELFKPDSRSDLKFTFKGGLTFTGGGIFKDNIECIITNHPEDWVKLTYELERQTQEKPLVTLKLTPPSKAIGSYSNKPEILELSFIKAWSSNSTAHGKAKGLTLEQGISFAPEIKGKWQADENDESKLVFLPEAPWPVGEKVKVSIDPSVFPTLEFKELSTEFTTPALLARLVATQLYTQPDDPTKRKVVSTLEFSHLPKTAMLNELFSAKFRVEPQKDFTKAKLLDTSFKVDEKQPWRIYLETELINLPDEPGEVQLELKPGVTAEEGGAASSANLFALQTIPSKNSVFKINSASVAVVKKVEEQLERVLSLEVSEPVSSQALLAAANLYLLPDCSAKKNKKVCNQQLRFGGEGRILPEVLQKSELLKLTALERDQQSAPNMFHFAFQAPGNRELFLLVNRALTSETKFNLAQDYRIVLFAEEFEKDLQIMHSGSLLSISGDKTIGIALRNVRGIEYELARILPRDVHHLVSVTSGNFSAPAFHTWSVGIDQLAETFRYVESFPAHDPAKTFYSSVNFERFLNKTELPKGLFLLTVREQLKPEEMLKPDCYYDCQVTPLTSKRLILLTDLGLLVKDSASGEHSVFVMSFRNGGPVVGATVKLLGQNGLPLFTAKTDSAGRVNFPRTNDFKMEKVPLLYTVESGGDFSFLPFGRGDRQLNFTRFETEGVYNSEEAEGLKAQIFSDRGIYRPGEEAKFGIIVRRRNLKLAGSDLPLEISLRDPRGVEIQRKKFALSNLGFDEYSWKAEDSVTGTYTLSVNLIRQVDGYDARSTLGATTFRVDEFQPDKLTVKATYAGAENLALPGWYKPDGQFAVTVNNLFGTPAVSNKVAAKLLPRAWDGKLNGFPEYLFYSLRTARTLPEQPDDLGELVTDTNGKVKFEPDLSKYSEAAFNVDFVAEAFEKGSGRSVVASTSALIATADYFVGWKSDGKLDFINKDGERKISLLAVSQGLKPQAVKNLKLVLEETQKISALVKQPNGTLQYQLTPRVNIISETNFDIAELGSDYMLATSEPGQYRLIIADQTGQELGAIPYFVHGEANKTFLADRSAEVGLRLSRTSVEKGAELELSINVPYSGSGLITIEREQVYAAKWFKTDTQSTVQKIRVPEDVVGNAYVSVAFVRSLDSKEIFSAPLSYAVQPFYIAKSEYTSKIDLAVPEKVKPGENLTVNYTLNSPAKLLIYAVDEGILQFARYRTPDPVSSFIPKRALEVESYQILDLLLPDHGIVSELAAVGGDEDGGLGKFKNPFARKRKPPVVFWSGVLPVEATTGKIEIPIPEYYNGTLRIIAIAVGEQRLGLAETKAVAQADFVIEPQVPYVVTPQDEFEVGATVANTVADSGQTVPVTIEVMTTSGLSILADSKIELNVPALEDRAFRVRLKANNELGEQTITFKALARGVTTQNSESLSLRPASMLRTELQSGSYIPERDGSKAENEVKLTRDLYAEERSVTASISTNPLGVGRSLIDYLRQYPYGCTEQLVSMAMPVVLFSQNTDLGIDDNAVKKFSKRAFQAISSRQRADGSIGLWDANSDSDPLFSVYAMHFLMEANAAGLETPEETYSRGKDWLRSLTSERSYEIYSQLAQVYALYLRAREGEQVTNLAKNLTAELNRQWQKKWQRSMIGVLLAGTYKILQMDSEADALMKNESQVWDSSLPWPLNDAALYLSTRAYIQGRHFADTTTPVPLDLALTINSMITERNFNSFNSAFALLGLSAFSEINADNQQNLRIIALDKDTKATALDLVGTRIFSTEIPSGTKQLLFGGSDQAFFWESKETGFDVGEPKQFSSGVTVNRELKNRSGEIMDIVKLEDKLDVTLYIKGTEQLNRMVVVELIPGGFEIDLSDDGLAKRKSLGSAPNPWAPEFIEIQEDRIIFFGDIPKDTVTFTYRLKPLSRGKYTFPPAFVEGMYDQRKGFQGVRQSVEIQ